MMEDAKTGKASFGRLGGMGSKNLSVDLDKIESNEALKELYKLKFNGNMVKVVTEYNVDELKEFISED